MAAARRACCGHEVSLGPLEELLHAGVDGAATANRALSECEYDTARLIIQAAALPLPFSVMLDPGETVFREGQGGVEVGYPGNTECRVRRFQRGRVRPRQGGEPGHMFLVSPGKGKLELQ